MPFAKCLLQGPVAPARGFPLCAICGGMQNSVEYLFAATFALRTKLRVGKAGGCTDARDG